MSIYPASPAHGDRPRALDWLVGSFWVADAMVLAMVAFFMVLGSVSPGETAGFAAAVTVLAALLGFHLWQLRRHRGDLERAPATRSARERRGF
jgi:hypothetical protein